MTTVTTEPEGRTHLTVPAPVVADHILYRRQHAGVETTVHRAIELTYSAHGWMLGFLGTPLFHDRIEAWERGPVIPTVYGMYQHFRGQPILEPGRDGTRWLREIHEDAPDIVMAVESNYRDFTSAQLSRLLRAKDSPWYKTFHEDGPAHPIPTSLIETYYQTLLERVKARGR